jgi:hypothetical protein
MRFSEYMKRRREIPRPRARTRSTRPIALRSRKANLARRMGWQKSQVDRLLDLRHRSRLDQIEAAPAKLHKRLAILIEDVPRAVA